MKFGKIMSTQMVPEWQEAYMDYNYLKSVLNEILIFNLRSKPNIASANGSNQMDTFHGASNGLRHRKNNLRQSPNGGDDLEHKVIQVNAVQNEGSDEHCRYETHFFMSNEEGGEYELVYFRRLDDEFNKVIKFYKEKVEDAVSEAAMLNKQLDALIAYRIRAADPEGSMDWSIDMSHLKSRISPVAEDVKETNSEESGENSTKDKPKAPLEILSQGNKFSNMLGNTCSPMKGIFRYSRTPCSPMKGILRYSNWDSKRKDLTRVEQKLKVAFIEFYQKLRLLKNYSSLNLLAFSKIMKKYDKITSRNASDLYLNMVKNSYLGSSDEVSKLMERGEATFIEHFAHANHSEGRSILRPKVIKERHKITYSLGFFSGCTVTLLVALILISRARKRIEPKNGNLYMETMFPLYSLFGFVVLNVFFYGLNIYFWRIYRVNYPFIFGFKQGTELGYREVFLFSAGLATLALASVIANLDMEMDPKTKDYKEITELLPLGLVILVLGIIFCPFNIIYRSSRFFLLQRTFYTICAPFYKVTVADFFLADQISSQVQSIRSLQLYICYYGWGDYKHRKNTCKSNSVYNIFSFIIVIIPFWWRFLQCLRLYFGEKDKVQGCNSLKYFATMVAVCMRTIYIWKPTLTKKVLAVITSIIAAVFSTLWDFIIDWDLLHPNSKNRWLRDKLPIPYKSVYYGVMVLNALLRFAWVQTLFNFQISFLHEEALVAVVASLEIIRRGIWNYFRLENLHLINVVKYRASKTVPLPFKDDEDKD